MAKMNMQAVAAKVGGYTAGLAAAGVIQKYLNGVSNPAVGKTWGPIAMIIGSAYLPSVVGKGNQLIAHAADAIMVKGVNTFMQDKFGGPGGWIAGPEEEVSGPWDDSVSGYPTADEVIVSGPYEPSDSVAGVGQYTN